MRPDVATAWANTSRKMGAKRDVRKLPQYLNGGETVLAMTRGYTASKYGLLVATDRRVLFVAEGMINHSFEDFPYDRISSVTSSRGLTRGKILIQTSGAARVIEQVPKGEAEAIAAVIRDRVEGMTRERSESAAQPVAGLLAAELRDLALLRDQGVLTSDEFEAQKKRLLAR